MEFNVFIRYFTFDVLVITNIIALYKAYKSYNCLVKYFDKLRQDMNGVMTSYQINIAQLCDLIDALFEIKKDVGK